MSHHCTLDEPLLLPLVALQDPGGASDGRGDEKKLRDDSPAVIDYACILKSCKSNCEKTMGEHREEGKWVSWEQEKESREVMSVIQTVQCVTICHHMLVSGVCSDVFVL
jgi:hypothetical protein